MFRYAQINIETGIVEGDSYLSKEMEQPNLIPVAEDFDLTNKKYVNGEWIEYVPEAEEEEPIEPEPTQLDRIEELVAKSHAQISQEAVDAYTLELIEGGIL